jgi:hypothetical protein
MNHGKLVSQTIEVKHTLRMVGWVTSRPHACMHVKTSLIELGAHLIDIYI